ncbi:hypothetical protein [Thalassotalea crassostreae]|uniref:hypothetical protein n=1 Tax=Thalassotalea crassostreae TaxID=1763536 RepID=UPI000837A9EB|nr:hypothetical protein [Thalassotalea crassostreae]
MKLSKSVIAITVSTALVATTSYAKDDVSADEAAKELANPNTAFASLSLKNQFKSFDDGTEVKQTLFQPSLPFVLSDGDKAIFRPAVPIVYDNRNGESGIGDIGFDLVYAPKSADPSNLFAYGVVGSLPTGSSDIGGGEVTAVGPALFVGKMKASGLIGAYTSHLESVDEGDLGDAGKLSVTSSQLMWINLAEGGWTWGSAPKIEYNHELEEDKLTVPVNFTISKTTFIGDRAWKFGVDLDYYVEKNDMYTPDYMITFTITPVVENMLNTWLNN